MRNSSAASLNIIISPWLLKSAAKQYQQKFDVPYLRWPGLPIGASDTSAFIRTIAKELGIEKRGENTYRYLVILDFLYYKVIK
ncbi:hypothetical protein LGK95_15080 [Clostridium algoriphilum]|nr:hypothetical protein [Clostridium algoriphilum]